MEAICSSVTLKGLYNQKNTRHNTEDHHLDSPRRGNLKSYWNTCLLYIVGVPHVCVCVCVCGRSFKNSVQPFFHDVLLELPEIKSVWENKHMATLLPLRVCEDDKPRFEPATPAFYLTACEPVGCSCNRAWSSHVVYSSINSTDQNPSWKADSSSADRATGGGGGAWAEG
jgi:hypothetical protein